jgi:hypothetical protein
MNTSDSKFKGEIQVETKNIIVISWVHFLPWRIVNTLNTALKLRILRDMLNQSSLCQEIVEL